MKKKLVFSFFGALLLSIWATSAVHARSSEPIAPSQFKSALVYDFQTNQVLYQHRAHERVDPASLVKMMVVLIAIERIEKGEIRLQDTIKVSARASRIGGHQVYLKQGEVFALQELLRAVIMASANDASFAVAEYVAGTQEKFVVLMNARARELGMVDTRFANAHGLPPDKSRGQEANYTSAYDLALLARELMKYPLVRQWAATRTGTFRNGKLMLVNTNRRFLQGFRGADGFKTGYHPRGAGFSLVATAQREGRRLVAVVLGAQSSRNRLQAVSHLLEQGFGGKLELRANAEPAVLAPPLVLGAQVASGERAEAAGFQ
jgi:D-alanyl-D-alanine carboxypeptidase (penicillin-binding protein 5/6)